MNLFRDKVYFPNLEQQKSQLAQEEENIELTDAIKEELDRRLERHRDGTAKYYSWEEVKKMLAEKRNKK